VGGDELFEAEHALLRALQQQDLAALAALLADDFLITTAGWIAEPADKPMWLSGLVEHRLDEFDLRLLAVRRYEDVAVVLPNRPRRALAPASPGSTPSATQTCGDAKTPAGSSPFVTLPPSPRVPARPAPAQGLADRCEPGWEGLPKQALPLSRTAVRSHERLDPFQDLGDVYTGGVADTGTVAVRDVGVHAQHGIRGTEQVGTTRVAKACPA
jgi:Domain of unknown function (DUF4440)